MSKGNSIEYGTDHGKDQGSQVKKATEPVKKYCMDRWLQQKSGEEAWNHVARDHGGDESKVSKAKI
jgi:hypothetical protein